MTRRLTDQGGRSGPVHVPIEQDRQRRPSVGELN